MKDTSGRNSPEKEFSEEINKLRAFKLTEEQISAPHMDEFRKMVRDAKEQKKKSIIRSNLLFVCIAVLFLFGVCISLLNAKVVFIILQCIAVAASPFVILYSKREKKYE